MSHKDPQKRKEFARNYYILHKEKLSKAMEEYRNNPEHKIQAKEYSKEYRKRFNKEIKEYKQNHYLENRDKIRKQHQEYYQGKRIYFINKQKDYNKKPINKSRRKIYIYQWTQYKKQNDYQYLIRRRLQTALRGAMCKYSRTGKIMSSTNGIDYKSIIEKLGPCPSDNQKEWHIDHIIPQVIFDFNDKEQIKLCYSPDNLRWYPAKDNLSKWARIEE